MGYNGTTRIFLYLNHMNGFVFQNSPCAKNLRVPLITHFEFDSELVYLARCQYSDSKTLRSSRLFGWNFYDATDPHKTEITMTNKQKFRISLVLCSSAFLQKFVQPIKGAN